MDFSWPETAPINRRKSAAEELLRGREFAEQLRSHLLRRSCSAAAAAGGGSVSDDLVSRIVTSFTKTISILNRGGGDSVSGDVNYGSVIVEGDSVEEHEESGESNCKSSSNYGVKRGSKRR